ncbi:hypothetical protein [Phycicoccus jejuensis]|uniref:hypothetical protein n=1 Tax=Phycicoccus jejuensis TaxID=367299 RepID=UPI0004C3A437|nr:hypothetical protein [Phycicoccus jejuensis]
MVDHFASRHFSVSNPEGPAGPDLPLLLRRVADAIEEAGIGSEELLDVTFCADEVNQHGAWWRATVYWAPDDPA